MVSATGTTAPPGAVPVPRMRTQSWRRRLRTLASPPILVFGAAEVIALFFWLSISRRLWFDLDEWDFLVQRRAGNLGDLFRPHNGHWTTVPILVYRFFFALVGLRTYLPYRLLAIVVYLISAALLLIVVRRAGVNPWIATAAATMYAFLGFGLANIIRGFQITLTGSVVFGLLQLLLTDHDGPVDRRDAAGIAAGFVGLLCSGLAIVMVMIVGAVALLKRGWRVALLHTAPFFVCYIVWLGIIGRESGGGVQRLDPTTIGHIAWNGWSVPADAIAPAGHGFLLAIVLVTGFALAAYTRRRTHMLSQLVTPVVMFAAAAVFLGVSAAFNRRDIISAHVFASQERYLSIAALLVIPAFAVALDAFVRRWRWLLPVALIALLACIPRNLQHASDSERLNELFVAGARNVVMTVPKSPRLDAVPRSLEPERIRSWRITAGWLRDSAAHGKLPLVKSLSPTQLNSVNFRLSFDLQPRPVPETNCTVLNQPLDYRPRRGDVIGLYNSAVFLRPNGKVPLNPSVVFGPERGRAIVVLQDVGPTTIGWFRGAFFTNVEPFQGAPRICIQRAAAAVPPTQQP